MPIPLVVNGTTYFYPVPGEDPAWGADATDWAKAVTEVLGTLLGIGDILGSTFAINNNIITDTNINGLLFDSGVIRAANINYAVYRISSASPSGHTETGQMSIVFDDNAAPGSKFQLTQTSDGDAGIIFSVDDTGQFKYRSTDIGSVGYVGSIRFSAKALTKI